MRRKDALVRLNGLAPQVEEHLQKLQNDPSSRDAGHWRKEIEAWLTHMEALLPNLGKKTSGLWAKRLESWKNELDQIL